MKEELRKEILELGADVCGFAEIEHFENAPKDFHPRNIFKECNSVIVFGVALPKGLYEVDPKIIYAHFNQLACSHIDHIGLQTAKIIENRYQGKGVPIPCDSPYEYWDEVNMEGRGVLSMKHAALLAGIGTIGRNTLLMNREYGNRLVLGCILTNLLIESDELAEPLCLEYCDLCIRSCPVGAIEDGQVNQKICRQNSYGKTKRGYETVECNKCRTVCPMRFGRFN